MSVAAALLCGLLLRVCAAQNDSALVHPNTTRPDSKCAGECVRCAPGGCVRCAALLVAGSRACVAACPLGTHAAWAQGDELMGRVCYPDNYYNEALVGVCAGVALVLMLAACGAAYARCCTRRQRPRPLPRAPPPDQDSAKLRDFHKQLDCLRPHAYTLLSILNNTRRQVRELYLLGNNDAAMAYSCVLSDLAKILLLLNKRHVPVVPEEWPRLASWAERILKRYSRITPPGQHQVAQLVNFLQTPSEPSEPKFTTFKPSSYASSSVCSEDFDKEYDFHWSEDLRPPSYYLIERDCIPLSDPWESRPIVRRESIWIEDEELKLARPQDELTTEL